MLIYLRKITNNDTKKQIETTAEAYERFFDGDESDLNGVDVEISNENDSDKGKFRISKAGGQANSYRFASVTGERSLSRFLLDNYDNYECDDILKIVKNKGKYNIELVRKSDIDYNTLSKLFVIKQNTVVIMDINSDRGFESIECKKLDYNIQNIYFGAPGTGKSYTLEQERKKTLQNETIGGYERVTFHPDYTYSQFVGTYKPVTDRSGTISYQFVPGPFMRVYVEALKNGRSGNPEPYILIIEEINRANVAAVFGDVFQLLDRDSFNVSEYPIHATEDVRTYLAVQLGGNPEDYTEIKIPDNMLIWATMNSADQGVFPMDTAFKRRWDFNYLGINNGEGEISGKFVILGEGEHRKKVEWNILRKEINNVLLNDCKVNEDKLMGPFFLEIKNLSESEKLDKDNFSRIFKNKVIMYLFDDAAKQKRPTLFSGCDIKNIYSAICDEFDEKGVDIFNESIRNAFLNSVDGVEE